MEPRTSGPRITTDFTIGQWYVRPSMNLISSRARTVQLEPKVMDMLVILAEHGGGAVSRDELHERLWPDAVVTDKALTRLASELRKAFGDDPRDPKFIATISKGGYRLVAPVTVVNPGDGSIEVSHPDVILTTPDAAPVRPIQDGARARSQLLVAIAAVAAIAAAITLGIANWPQSNPQYSPAIQLTSYAGHEISPAISPNGDHVAFSWQGAAGGNWDVYVKQPGSDGLLRLTDDSADHLHPTWSPDGTKIAFLRFDESTCSIEWVPALSGAVRRIASCEWVDEDDRPYRTSGIDWSPDGRSIAAGGLDGIHLVDIQTGEQTLATHRPDGAIVDINPAFSPDGRTIAFTRILRRASSDLLTVDLDSGPGTTRRLTTEARLILGHDWTPDGEAILFSSNRTGRFSLWRIAAAGGSPVAVAADGWNIEKISAALDEDRIAYEGWIYDTNVWRIPIGARAAAPPTNLIHSTLWDRDAVISPDGARIAFISNRSGSWEVWLSNGDGSGQVKLTSFGAGVVGVPRWSPDGARLAVQAQDREGADIYTIDVASGLMTRVTDDPADDVAPAWSPDGETIFYGSNESGSWQIWATGLGQITRDGGYSAQASPDGRDIFFTRPDSSGIWRQKFGEPTAERISESPASNDWGNWVVTERGIYILERGGREEPARLVLLDPSTGTTNEVTRLERAPTPHHPGLSVDPNGSTILLTLVDATESDLFVMDLPSYRP